ncbi:MAG: GIY-YIG nuclease family protein [Pirellulaceae bacterium]
MDANLSEETFVDFGPDALYPFPRTGLRRISGETAELKQQVRQYVPREPGVYGMLDPLQRLIYVGKSKSLRNRLLSYFLPNNEEDKAGRIVQTTAEIVWETQPNEFAALVREQQLIRTFQPRFNVQGIPRRQQPIFICLGRSPEQLYTARRHDPKAAYVLGPLFGSSRASRAVEVLNRLFLLRDCSSKQPCSFTEQLQLFAIELRPGCIRLELQSCLGPCISACSRSAYDQQVNLARAFLEGESTAPLKQLEQRMLAAAARQHFEQASVLREDLRAITWLSRRADDIAQARQRYTFVYPVAGIDGQCRKVWYLIRRGILEGAVAAPSTPAEEQATRQLLLQWLDADQHVGHRFAPRPETLALIASWFRNQRSELKNTFIPNPTATMAMNARTAQNLLRKSESRSAVKV